MTTPAPDEGGRSATRFAGPRRDSGGVEEMSTLALVVRNLRLVGIYVLGGIGAGAVAGLASRVAMRLSGLLAGPSPSRIVTFDGFILGTVTFRGTVFLVVTGVAVGIVGGLTYAVSRDWVAPAGRWRGLVFGVVLAVAFGRLVFDRANFDFTVFGPPAVNVPLYASIFVLFGLLVAPAVTRLDQRVPRMPLGTEAGRRERWGAYGAVVAGIIALLPLALIAVQALSGNLIERPSDVGPATALAVMFAILLVAPLAARLRDRGGPATWVGYALVAAPVGAGGFITVREVVAILAA